MYSIIIAFLTLLQTSIYSLSFKNIEGTQVNMSSFQGKKILLVNIATGSPRISQLAGLQELQQVYGDSVVIIAFPSNSFAHETRTNDEIRSFCQNNYGVSFILAEQCIVAGTGSQPIYQWLANKTENGDLDTVVGGDFQKVLIGKDGMIIGVFAPSVPPTDISIRNALTGN